MIRRGAALVAAGACATSPAVAQTNHGGQIWGSIQVVAPVRDDIFLSMDIQPRWTTRNAATAPITIIPPVISWRVNESLIVSGGYLYAHIDGARLPQSLHENRVFQQIGYRVGAFGRVGLRAQTRLEQRQRSTGSDWNIRVAQQLLLATPLTKKESGGPVAVVSTELYWNLTKADWGARRGYDDLWSFIGMQVPLASNAALEVGYLNQRQRQVAGRVNMNHAAVIGFSFQLARPIKPPPVVPTIGPAAGGVPAKAHEPVKTRE